MHSDALNIDVSNEQATNAQAQLHLMTKDDTAFSTAFKPFASFDEMIVARLYLDRLGPQMAADREYLNQRVDILIE
jgi:hypothetical protein